MEKKHYMMNEAGKDWIWEAKDEYEATLLFINDFFSETFKTWQQGFEKWEKHCEDEGQDDRIEWQEYEKIFADDSEGLHDFKWSIVK